MDGTTEEMMMPRTSAASIFSIEKRFRKRTPYSSTVWFLMVATRQWAIMRGSALGCFTNPTCATSYTPSTVLVLPTSTTSSIRSPPWQRTNTAGNYDAQSPVGAHAKKPPRVKPIGGATVAAIFVYMHALAVSIRGPGFDLPVERAELYARNFNGIVHRPHQSAIFAVKRF